MNLVTQSFPAPQLFTITGEAEEARNELALTALSIQSVTTAQENAVTANVVRDLKAYIKEKQAWRLSYARPINDALSMLKRTVDEHTGPLQEQVDRLEGLGLTYLKEEEKRKQAAELERAAELARLEVARREAELKVSGELLPAPEASEALETAATALDVALRSDGPRMAKASGQCIKRTLGWEVTDIAELYKAAPHLVKLEPNAAAIQACCIPEMPVSGLKLWWKEKGSYRA